MFSKNAIILIFAVTILMNACVATQTSDVATQPTLEPKNNPNAIENVLSDDDDDGVPNYLDREKNTPAGATVNTHGETLDSDGDGIADYLDKEPFSKPDAKFETILETKNYITKEEIIYLEKERNWRNDEPILCPSKNERLPYLPTLIFEIGASKIKDHHFVALKHVADLLKKSPDMAIVVEGHANGVGEDEANLILSYQRAKSVIDFLTDEHNIHRARLVLRYQGEKAPLNGAKKDLAINCRVELRVNEDGETEMNTPLERGKR